MRRRKSEPLIDPHFSVPEFDVRLCGAVYSSIAEKTSLDERTGRELAHHITESIGYLCSAVEHGFIQEVDARVGSDQYGVRVFLQRRDQELAL